MSTRENRGTASWARVCYGVDLSDAGPVIVRTVRSRGGMEHRSVSADDPAMRAEIRKSSVIVAGYLPERESFARWLTAPFASVRKARQVFHSLLDIQLPFALEDCVCDFLPWSATADGKARALAVAARCSNVEKRIAQYAQFGVDPAVLDQEGVALWTQTVLESPPREGATRVLVNLRGERATMVVGKGREFVSAHSIAVSAAGVDRILCAQLGVGDGSVEWAWAGPGAADAARVAALHGELRLRWHGESRVHADPAAFLARALGVRVLTSGPMRCNLRTGGFRHARLSAREGKQSMTAALAVFAAGVMLCAASYVCGRQIDVQCRSSETRFYSLAKGMAGNLGGRKGADAVEEVQKRLSERTKVYRPFVEAFNPSLSACLEALVRTACSEGIGLNFVSIRRGSVSITGTAASGEGCDMLQRRLTQLGFPVKLHRREVSGDGRIQFSIAPGGPND